jgi:hypothetical protein
VTDISKEGKGAFAATLASAEPGDEITYHVGEFAGGPHREPAYTAYERGQVILVQRRLEPRRFAFLAIRTRKK